MRWFGPTVVRSLVNKHSPESVCHSLKICVMDDPSQRQCALFHKAKTKPQSGTSRSKSAPDYLDFQKSIVVTRAMFHSRAVSLKLVDAYDLGIFMIYPVFSYFRTKELNVRMLTVLL